jgi:hypothetical protein
MLKLLFCGSSSWSNLAIISKKAKIFGSIDRHKRPFQVGLALPPPPQTTPLQTMKFHAALLLFLTAGKAFAFSAVAPPSTNVPVAGGAEPIDRTMNGIDAAGAFDPTDGDSPAVARNNNDEVWVQQVCTCCYVVRCQPIKLVTGPHMFLSIARASSSQQKVTRDSWHGAGKHCHARKFHPAPLHSRRRL